LQNATLQVFNSVGEPVFKVPMVANQSLQVDTQRWPSGLYHYRIDADHKSVYYGSVSLLQ